MPSRRDQAPNNADKVADAKFLVDEFGISAPKVAGLIVGEGEPAPVTDEILAQVQQQVRTEDSLADKPTPEAPANDLVADTDEQRLKPVLHNSNKRLGAG
jgi:hypothetical protein